jgi:hypothetical protein
MISTWTPSTNIKTQNVTRYVTNVSSSLHKWRLRGTIIPNIGNCLRSTEGHIQEDPNLKCYSPPWWALQSVTCWSDISPALLGVYLHILDISEFSTPKLTNYCAIYILWLLHLGYLRTRTPKRYLILNMLMENFSDRTVNGQRKFSIAIMDRENFYSCKGQWQIVKQTIVTALFGQQTWLRQNLSKNGQNRSSFWVQIWQNKLFLTSGWPGQTLHHKIQYGYDLSFNTQY